MAEQRYQAVLAVIADGLSVQQAAEKTGVSRQTLHSWLARYEADGLQGLVDRSHRPSSCPQLARKSLASGTRTAIGTTGLVSGAGQVGAPSRSRSTRVGAVIDRLESLDVLDTHR